MQFGQLKRRNVITLLGGASAAVTSEVAILAGGCFWGVQGVFAHVEGVAKAVSAYAGGNEATATYKAVSAGTTAHAESVRVTFDPHRISYSPHTANLFFSRPRSDPADAAPDLPIYRAQRSAEGRKPQAPLP
jgi:peptide methionine sulfoxide reductase MsrA